MESLRRIAGPSIRLVATAAVLAVSTPRPSAAQLPPLTVPRRHVRMDIGGNLGGWDQRFRAGTTEDAAHDFVRDAVGSEFFPALAPAESILARVTGLPDSRFDLGRTTATQLVTRGTAALGLAYGLTSRLTLFGMVPIVRIQVRSTFAQDSAQANSGFNPADPVFGDPGGQAQTTQFFSQFDAALAQLAGKLASGDYTDPATRQLAQETLAAGTALRQDLFAVMLGTAASPFLPTRGSPMGGALLGTVTSLQGTLSGSLGITGFSQTPALPFRRLDDAGFADFINNSDGPVAGSLDTPVLAALGDIELGAAYAIVDQLSRPGARSGIRLAAQGLIRLRTSTRPAPGRFFDVGTGDRQPDVQLGLAADGVFGRLGARLTAGYNLQLAGKANSRISEPSRPIAYANTFAGVQNDLGDELMVGVMPFFRLVPTFGIVAGVRYTKKGKDVWSLLPGQDSVPGAPPDLLGLDSEASWTTASFGLSFSSPLDVRSGKPKLPLDAGLMWEGVVAAKGGRVPKESGVRFFLRLYQRFP